MQTRKDCQLKTAGLVGDPYLDWLTEEYFSPLCNTAYDQAIQYLTGTCAPNIEKVVIVPGVQLGPDENNLIPSSISTAKNPVGTLVKPRYIDFQLPGTTRWLPAREFSILPDSLVQITPQTYNIRVRGDFMPAPLTSDDSLIEIHPNAAHALAYSVAALIGAERPNDGWTTKYGALAQNAWDEIGADIQRQQQHLTFRIGSPNRQNRSGYVWGPNLQANVGWEWRSYRLYLKLI
jgi:hypothetical protein